LILIFDRTLMTYSALKHFKIGDFFRLCMGSVPVLAITSPYVDSRVDSQHIYHGQPHARVDLNPMPESTLSPSQGLRIWTLLSVPVIPWQNIWTELKSGHLLDDFLADPCKVTYYSWIHCPLLGGYSRLWHRVVAPASLSSLTDPYDNPMT
jgi:hypothetical protein